MTSLQQFNKDGIEILIDLNTGESFASISGYVRMSNKAQSTISERYRKLTPIEAQIHTPGGLQGVRLINEDTIADWIVDDNPTMAKKLIKLGVRVFLHELAGYKVTSEAIQPLPRQLPPVRDRIDYVDAIEKVERFKEKIRPKERGFRPILLIKS